jgi:HEAT repeat protein
MALTMENVRTALLPDEPNYSRARELGPGAIPFLSQLVAQGDSMLAAKATYLAGLIGTDDGAHVVANAAGSPEPTVRVAAAAVARELGPDTAGPILTKLLADPDRGVRHRALRSAALGLTPALRTQIERMAQDDHDQLVRKEATTVLGSH